MEKLDQIINLAQPLSTAEVNWAKQYAIGSMRTALSTQAAMASSLMSGVLHNFPSGWLAASLASLDQVTLDDVNSIAASWFGRHQYDAVAAGATDYTENHD